MDSTLKKDSIHLIFFNNTAPSVSVYFLKLTKTKVNSDEIHILDPKMFSIFQQF